METANLEHFVEEYVETGNMAALVDYLIETNDNSWLPTIQVLKHSHLPIFEIEFISEKRSYASNRTRQSHSQKTFNLDGAIKSLADIDDHWNASHYPVTINDEGIVQLSTDWMQFQKYDEYVWAVIGLKKNTVPAGDPLIQNKKGEFVNYLPKPIPYIIHRLLGVDIT